MQKRYKKAPITEAIIDLKVTLPEGFTLDGLNDIYSRVKDKFPNKAPFYRGTGAFLFNPGEAPKVDAGQQQIGFWFRSEDNLQTFQATLERFSFNQLAPYESWEKLKSEAQNVWAIYQEICQPSQVTQVAVRYINQINIPASEHSRFAQNLDRMEE
jgi:uncharacterized protein (TIGR04255 family)